MEKQVERERKCEGKIGRERENVKEKEKERKRYQTDKLSTCSKNAEAKSN